MTSPTRQGPNPLGSHTIVQAFARDVYSLHTEVQHRHGMHTRAHKHTYRTHADTHTHTHYCTTQLATAIASSATAARCSYSYSHFSTSYYSSTTSTATTTTTTTTTTTATTIAASVYLLVDIYLAEMSEWKHRPELSKSSNETMPQGWLLSVQPSV